MDIRITPPTGRVLRPGVPVNFPETLAPKMTNDFEWNGHSITHPEEFKTSDRATTRLAGAVGVVNMQFESEPGRRTAVNLFTGAEFGRAPNPFAAQDLEREVRRTHPNVTLGWFDLPKTPTGGFGGIALRELRIPMMTGAADAQAGAALRPFSSLLRGTDGTLQLARTARSYGTLADGSSLNLISGPKAFYYVRELGA